MRLGPPRQALYNDRDRRQTIQPFLSIVIPAYNEERRILPTLKQVLGYLGGQDYPAEVIVVDDGSRDRTVELVLSVSPSAPSLRLICNPHRGKGAAVKTGMLRAEGSYRFLCDADLSMPIEQVARFLPPQCVDFDLALGSREAVGARRFHEPVLRHFSGHLFNAVVRLLAVSGITDTQCGFKCFRGEVAEFLFPQVTIDGFGFDVEVLFLARKHRLRLVEVPIDWYYETESKVRLWRHTWSMLREVLQVRGNDWRGRYRGNLAERQGRD